MRRAKRLFVGQIPCMPLLRPVSKQTGHRSDLTTERMLRRKQDQAFWLPQREYVSVCRQAESVGQAEQDGAWPREGGRCMLGPTAFVQQCSGDGGCHCRTGTRVGACPKAFTAAHTFQFGHTFAVITVFRFRSDRVRCSHEARAPVMELASVTAWAEHWRCAPRTGPGRTVENMQRRDWAPTTSTRRSAPNRRGLTAHRWGQVNPKVRHALGQPEASWGLTPLQTVMLRRL